MKQKQPKKKKQAAKGTKMKSTNLDEEFEALQIHGDSDAESFAQCPICGLIYGEDESVWICCDICNTWYDLKCSMVTDDNIPDEYICQDC